MIYGQHIRLRAPERSDLPQFVAWLNDPEVIAGLLLYLPMSLASEEEWFNGLSKREPAERPMVIEVQQDDGWKAVGNCGFHNLDWRIRCAEVGIFIGDKSFWNRGYGTQVMHLLLQFGFETLNLNRIYLKVFETNPRAVRTYEKVGFVHEGRERQAGYHEGRYRDVLLMSVLRSEWDSR